MPRPRARSRAGSGVPIDLAGQVAIVTGGSRGIGRAVVGSLAAAGARVVFSYRRDAVAARATVRAVTAAFGVAVGVRADAARPAGGRALARAALTRFGRIDILVNNAGIWEPPEGVALERLSAAQWRRTMAVNLDGVFHATRAVIPAMKQRRGGRIVMVASTAAQRGEALHGDYAASKGALVSLTKSLAVELGPWGILVNAVAPWWVDTDMSHQAILDGERDGTLFAGESSPLGRVATADEIAGPILFLCSGLATFVTGEILNVNGGSVLCG